MNTEEKIVAITGCTGGIGKELCLKFAKDQWNLVLIGRNIEKLNELSNKLKEEFGRTSWVICQDLREPNASKKIYAEVKRLDLKVDVLIQAAGFGVYGDFLERDAFLHRELIYVNLQELVELCHLFGKDMKESRSGYIINFSSISAFFPGPYLSTYYASKAFILSFSLALQRELKKFDVAVLAVCPGVINTQFYEKAKADISYSYLLERMKPASLRWAVSQIYKQIQRNKTGYKILGLKNKLLIFFSRIIPLKGLSKIIAFVQAKKQKTKLFFKSQD